MSLARVIESLYLQMDVLESSLPSDPVDPSVMAHPVLDSLVQYLECEAVEHPSKGAGEAAFHDLLTSTLGVAPNTFSFMGESKRGTPHGIARAASLVGEEINFDWPIYFYQAIFPPSGIIITILNLLRYASCSFSVHPKFMWKQIGRLVGWFTKWNATSAQPPLSAHAALEEMRSLLVKVELELRMYDQQRSSLIESCRSMREEVEAMIMESLDGHSLRISPANESLCEAPSCSPKLLPAASRMISEMYSEVKRLETSIMVRRDALDAKRAKAEIQARYLRASVRTTSNALQEGAAALGIPLANFPIDSGDSSPSSSRPTPPLSTPTHSQGATDPGTTSIFFISSEQYSVVP